MEETDELRSVVRSFFRDVAPAAEVRRLMEEPLGYDPAVWARMGTELGLCGLAVAERYGGAGATAVELGVVAEEAGRALLCAPFLSSSVLAATALSGAQGPEAERALGGMADGTCVATLAVAEADGQWDVATSRTEAVAQTDGTWRLHGEKWFVTDATAADVVLVAARDGLFLVGATAPGVRCTPLATLDLTRRQGVVRLDGAPAVRVGGDDAVRRALAVGAAVLAAEQVGGMRQVLEDAADHARTRVQFGRAIGSFQAVKHALADMLIEVESAASAAYRALAVLDDPAAAGEDDPALVVPLAKAFCSDAYTRVTAQAVQIFGGVGFTWEHPVHLYLKRARADRQLLGDPRMHRGLVAARLAEGAA